MAGLLAPAPGRLPSRAAYKGTGLAAWVDARDVMGATGRLACRYLDGAVRNVGEKSAEFRRDRGTANRAWVRQRAITEAARTTESVHPSGFPVTPPPYLRRCPERYPPPSALSSKMPRTVPTALRPIFEDAPNGTHRPPPYLRRCPERYPPPSALSSKMPRTVPTALRPIFEDAPKRTHHLPPYLRRCPEASHSPRLLWPTLRTLHVRRCRELLWPTFANCKVAVRREETCTRATLAPARLAKVDPGQFAERKTFVRPSGTGLPNRRTPRKSHGRGRGRIGRRCGVSRGRGWRPATPPCPGRDQIADATHCLTSPNAAKIRLRGRGRLPSVHRGRSTRSPRPRLTPHRRPLRAKGAAPRRPDDRRPTTDDRRPTTDDRRQAQSRG